MSQNNKQGKDDDSSPFVIWLVCLFVGYVLYAVLIG